MLSDNRGNFVGGNKELSDLVKELDQDKIGKSTAYQGIKWTFNPPHAPHFGGVQEIMIKGATYNLPLRRIISSLVRPADILHQNQ